MMYLSLLVATVVMAQAPALQPNSNPTKKPMISGSDSSVHMAKEVNPPTYAAEVTKDCPVKQQGKSNQAEICLEGSKKFCPKGYTMKQKPHACPEGKMCAQVMQDYCEKGIAK